MIAPAVVGICGKHPERRDFVRWGDVGELSPGFEAWVGEEQVRAPGRVAPDPSRPIRFACKRGGGRRVLTGSWVESRDAVGRRFPLIGYAEVEVAAQLELAPMATARFDEEMEAALWGGSAAAVSSGVEAMLGPCEDDWAIAAARFGRYVRGLTVREWGERVFGGFAGLVPSAIDSAERLADAVRRCAGRSVSARFVGGDLRDLAVWMKVLGLSEGTMTSAWVALWEPQGAVCALGVGESLTDLVATLRPAPGFRTRAWRFDPAYVQDLGAEGRAALDRPLADLVMADVREQVGTAKR